MGKLALVMDSRVYYEHIKFFLDNLARGVIPLWDPTRQWGTPNEFFLRRIGEYNPAYFLIIILNCLYSGLSYFLGFLFFLRGRRILPGGQKIFKGYTFRLFSVSLINIFFSKHETF